MVNLVKGIKFYNQKFNGLVNILNNHINIILKLDFNF